MTYPNMVRDLLMFPASFNLFPAAADNFYLSDPAKSTKFNLEVVVIFISFSFVII